MKNNLFRRMGMKLFGLSIGLTLGVVFIGGPAQGQIKLRYANFPPSTTFPCIQMDRWKAEIEKKTDGKVKIETFPGGSLLGAKNMHEGVISGIADIGAFPFSYHPGKFKLMDIFGNQFGWHNAAAASATLWDLFEKYDFESVKNVKILSLFTISPAQIMSMKPIKKMEDLKGYELRTSGSWVKALDLLGGTPIAIPMSDVPEAIQRGVVKGLISSLEVMKDMNFAAHCKYVTMCYLPVAPWVVIMNKDKWDSLTPEIRKVMDTMRREHSIWTGQYNDRHEKEAMDWSIEKYKVEVIKLTPDELKRWEDKLKPLSTQDLNVSEGKVQGKAFLDDLLQLKAKYSKEYAK